ncbi:MAG TPA: phenylacetic acid degradation bifunctional protein PaaZ [Flavobacteriales bacterium]|nr:phenylacetic acid degradation bifunctional protein PaaZ [Flavobacteriales bacterium]HMR26763.1 phenylacetic acid degradation bifunctional protein PaaZ [Flavobacteriales bacterium]
MQLQNYIAGQWIAGSGKQAELLDASTGELVATTSSTGLDFAAMLHYARTVGGPKLRKMTFPERGRMLKALALYLMERKDTYYTISYKTGATKADSWVDIEGGIGNLFANASLRRTLGNMPFYVDGEAIKTSKTGSFIGHHIMVPKEGVAVHINAFNFPIWGMLEKCAVNWMAGVPAVVKPATVTSYLTEAMVKDIIASGILPEGALQLIVGSAGDLLDHVMSQDVVTFTGSASTGRMLKRHDRLIDESVPFNMEADSLNAIVLGPDAVPGTEEYDLFIKEVGREITLKCGQRCTGARRILVPQNLIEDVQIALGKRLAGTVIGDPRAEGVRMGALAGTAQREEVKRALAELLKASQVVYGDPDSVNVTGADVAKGAFMSPILLLNPDPWKNQQSHNVEAFGPVSTLMPYTDLDDAVALTKLGKGSLVATIATYDDKLAQQFVWGAASHHGRMLVLNRDMAKENTGHGSPLATLVHGGPGRAGGGEEMGGKRGVLHYLQRTAIQGSPTTITALTQQYQQGATYHPPYGGQHPFRLHFEELNIGDTLITEKHLVTLQNVEDFAALSGDRFYAHMDANSLDGTPFTGRVAHGYFILSRAAGLFVDPPKGPVLLNYGIEECRFLKPVYPGSTIQVKFTCREKLDQEKRPKTADSPKGADVARGIVKWLVDVVDETGETVALATILTMVKKLDQS